MIHKEKFGHEYLEMPRDQFMMLSKHVLNKPVIDAHGTKLGVISDVLITQTLCDALPACKHSFPTVSGMIVNKRFISWRSVVSFADYLLLKERGFSLYPEPIPTDKIMLSKQILDEQMLDENGKHIGCVDDLALAYDKENTVLKIIGICSGISVRMGFNKLVDIFPWPCIKHIRFEKPTAIILRSDAKKYKPMLKKSIKLKRVSAS